MLKPALALILAMVAAGSVEAVTLTFNGTAADGQANLAGTEYIESGFKMSTSSGLFFIDDDFPLVGTGVFDDDFLELDTDPLSGPRSVTFTRVDGGAFNVLSLRLGGIGAPATTEITFSGLFSGGGGNVIQLATATVGNHDLIDLSAFTGIVSLTIAVGGTLPGFPAIDDLNVAPVPLPASLALFAGGLCGMRLVRRRATRAA